MYFDFCPYLASSKKRKSRQAEVPKAKDKDKEKDKRAKDKRDKRTHRKSGDDLLHTTADVTPRNDPMPPISSITDVFAEELLEKAKKTLDIDGNLKDELLLKKKKRKAVEDEEQPQPQPQPQTKDLQPTSKDSDLPTMSEISSTTTSGNREKDIAELAEIQRKIYAAKQQLRQIGELDDETDEEEPQTPDEYTPRLNEPKKVVTNNAAPVVEEVNSNSANSNTRRPKSPIVFNRTSEPVVAREKPKAQTEVEAQQKLSDEHLERRSVHERLGCKPQTPQLPDRPQRAQKEVKLYVPAHRRRSEQEPEENKKLDRSRERRERNESQTAHRRDRERETLNRRRSPSRSPKSNNYKHRIGSRVIVAVNKPPEPSDDEDLLEKPVNSVIKIKPRPHVSPRRQACKNLLLRAVADAQRSTILAKTTTTSSGSMHRGNEDEPEIISSTLGKRRSTDSTGDRPRRELFRRSRRELVVNVLHRDRKRMRPSVEPHSEVNLGAKDEMEEEEYVPSLGVGDYEAYVPQLVHNTKESDIDIDMHVDKDVASVGCSSAAVPKTQFVVTLNGDKSLGNAAAAAYRKRPRKRTPSPQVSSTSSATLQLSVEPTSTVCTATSSTNSNNRQNKAKRARSNSRSSPSTSSNTPPPKPSRSLRRSEVLRQTQEIKKIIIKNDADDDDDDEQLPASPRKRSASKRLSSSSNQAASSSNDHKSDLKAQLEENNRSTTPPLPPKLLEKRNIGREKSSNATITNSTTVETASKAKHTPIRFKIKPEEEQQQSQKKRRSGSKDRESSMERRRISIRNAEDRKYDNLPTRKYIKLTNLTLFIDVDRQYLTLPAPFIDIGL